MVSLASLSTSCAPYVGYTHMSDPRIANDGYDLVCVGGEKGERFLIDTAVCKDIRGGEMIKVDVRYKP